jgi:hypothetical protein
MFGLSKGKILMLMLHVKPYLGGFELATALDEVGHVHHDATHVLGQRHYVVVPVLPFSHLPLFHKISNRWNGTVSECHHL